MTNARKAHLQKRQAFLVTKMTGTAGKLRAKNAKTSVDLGYPDFLLVSM